MADADPQPVEPAIAKQGDGIAQAVLAAVAPIKLQACHTGLQIELVMRQQTLAWLQLPVLQGSQHGSAGMVHEGGRFKQMDGLAGNHGERCAKRRYGGRGNDQAPGLEIGSFSKILFKAKARQQ